MEALWLVWLNGPTALAWRYEISAADNWSFAGKTINSPYKN